MVTGSSCASARERHDVDDRKATRTAAAIRLVFIFSSARRRRVRDGAPGRTDASERVVAHDTPVRGLRWSLRWSGRRRRRRAAAGGGGGGRRGEAAARAGDRRRAAPAAGGGGAAARSGAVARLVAGGRRLGLRRGGRGGRGGRGRRGLDLRRRRRDLCGGRRGRPDARPASAWPWRVVGQARTSGRARGRPRWRGRATTKMAVLLDFFGTNVVVEAPGANGSAASGNGSARRRVAAADATRPRARGGRVAMTCVLPAGVGRSRTAPAVTARRWRPARCGATAAVRTAATVRFRACAGGARRRPGMQRRLRDARRHAVERVRPASDDRRGAHRRRASGAGGACGTAAALGGARRSRRPRRGRTSPSSVSHAGVKEAAN